MSGRLLLVRARGWYVVYPSYYCTSTMPTVPILSGMSSLFFAWESYPPVKKAQELICDALLDAQYHGLEHRIRGRHLPAGSFSPLLSCAWE